jgi:PIN domain nuclease of toxin-antitoxin system
VAIFVEALLRRASISTVNWAEVAQKSIQKGLPLDGLRDHFEANGLENRPVFLRAGGTGCTTPGVDSHFGLSLGDRACLSTAMTMDVRAITADRVWQNLDIGVQIQLVR